MTEWLQNLQQRSRRRIAGFANDLDRPGCLPLHMSATGPPNGKRKHFIPEYAHDKKKTQADIARATGADKGLVSRWFSGTTPQDKYLDALVRLFELSDWSALFRHPKDEWLVQFSRSLSDDENQRMRTILKATFQK
jgi:hypothetical protein